MQYLFHFCDPIASFAEGSQGSVQRRIIDRQGQAHLGVEVWELGREAYEMLRTADGRHMTLDELKEIPGAMESFVAGFFALVDDLVAAGNLGLIERDGGVPLSTPIQWRDASWGWQVGTMARILAALADYRADFALELLTLSSGETFEASQLSAVLHLLDEAVLASLDRNFVVVGARVHEASWLLENVKAPERAARAGSAIASRWASEQASQRATARHANHPKRAARDFAKEQWQAWRRQPTIYKTAVAFAKDMLDKFPDVLTSEVVVTRWVRAWDKERAQSPPAKDLE